MYFSYFNQKLYLLKAIWQLTESLGRLERQCGLKAVQSEVTKLQPQTAPLGPMLLSQMTVNNSDSGQGTLFQRPLPLLPFKAIYIHHHPH